MKAIGANVAVEPDKPKPPPLGRAMPGMLLYLSRADARPALIYWRRGRLMTMAGSRGDAEKEDTGDGE